MSTGKEPFTKTKRRILGAGFGTFLLLVWQIAAMMLQKSYLLPGPLDILDKIRQSGPELFSIHLPATLLVMGLGLLCSIILGSLLAIWMDRFPAIEKALYPILTFTQTIPVMCLAPVLVLWFGYSVLMRVIVVVLVTFFTITVNLFDGFQASSKQAGELLKTFGAGNGQQRKLLRFPTALPYLFTALHIALPWSAIGAVISEWLGAPRGLGVFSKESMMRLDAAGLLAPFVIISVIVLLLNALLRIPEKKLSWMQEPTERSV